MRACILGGGAIGLAIAWRLLQRGAHVEVVERGALGRGASWASAGLLAPTAGHGGPAGSPLDALCRRGITHWPAFAAELAEASGIDVALRTEGTLVVALDEDGATHLRDAFEAWTAAGDDAQRWLTQADVVAREPSLAATTVAARYCPGDWQVDARRLVTALVAAVRRVGGIMREHAETPLTAPDVTIVATGAWTPFAVRPVKGQMIALGNGPALRHVVFTPDVYLVPRDDGRLLVGATVEERGFDDTVTDDAVRWLHDAAARTIPSLGDAPVLDAWAGLRPVTPDGAPLLGRLDAHRLVATGHGRNGILLTPITAALIADLASGTAVDGLAPFGPERFAPVGGREPERERGAASDFALDGEVAAE